MIEMSDLFSRRRAPRWRAHGPENKGGADLNLKLRDFSLLRSIFGSGASNALVPKWPKPVAATWTPCKSLSNNDVGGRDYGGTESRKALETRRR